MNIFREYLYIYSNGIIHINVKIAEILHKLYVRKIYTKPT